MDKLDRLIAEKQAQIDQLKKEIDERSARYDRILIELSALKDAARARPALRVGSAESPVRPEKKQKDTNRGGRRTGDISREWRAVLEKGASLHRRLDYADFAEIAKECGIKTQMPNVRERVRTMHTNGLLTGGPDKGFLVTLDAVRRFELKVAPASQEAASAA